MVSPREQHHLTHGLPPMASPRVAPRGSVGPPLGNSGILRKGCMCHCLLYKIGIDLIENYMEEKISKNIHCNFSITSNLNI